MSEAATPAESNVVEQLMEDNRVLATWVAGVLEGCKGCIEEAEVWLQGQAALRASHESEGESDEG